MLGGVEEDDLVVPLGDRFLLRDQARGIVAAAFGGAGAARRGARIILRHPERHRGGTRLEIIADRRGDDEEMIFGRSEEHTSELQSLMRISYAVFCLQNKTTLRQVTHN